MKHCLYVIKPFRYERESKECNCHETIRFDKGLRLYVVNDPFYIENSGWFVYVQIQKDAPFRMSASFIDELYRKQAVMTWMDVELQLNYQQHKVDQALHARDEGLFRFYTNTFTQLKKLYHHETVAKGSMS
jgi:hypothetical protein